MPSFRINTAFKIFFLAFLLFGCEAPKVVENISQSQAIEIVALLSANGISATAYKDKGASGSYTITVRKGQYHQSIGLLQANDLPSEREMTFKDLVEERGFLPNSRKIEGLRYDHAVALELEELLENTAGVAAAKVVVRTSSEKLDSKPGASIVLQVKEEIQVSREQIEALVKTVLPGINSEDIVIVMGNIRPVEIVGESQSVGLYNDGRGHLISVPLTSFFFWYLPEGDLEQVSLFLGFALFAAILMGALFGWSFFYYRSSKNLSKRTSSNLMRINLEDSPKLPQVDRNES